MSGKCLRRGTKLAHGLHFVNFPESICVTQRIECGEGAGVEVKRLQYRTSSVCRVAAQVARALLRSARTRVRVRVPSFNLNAT